MAIYIVLGVLYEKSERIRSRSSRPCRRRGLGALLALQLTDTPLTVIAFVGIILLIGIVKKNGIMMVDFALDAERNRGLSSKRTRSLEACRTQLPPYPDDDDGGAIRHGFRWSSPPAPAPSCAGRSASPSSAACSCHQILTLYTTPVIYLLIDRLRRRREQGRALNIISAKQ